MEKRYHENDYLYAGARIRAAERIFPGRERLLSFAESKNEEELRAALVSGGIPAAKDLPESLVLFAMSLVRESLPDDLTVFVGYFYDCHNLKSLFKCRERGIDPESLLSPLGRVPVRELCKDFEKSDFSRLSPHMAAAAEEVRVAYLATADPREFDFRLDRACFEDLFEAASGFPFAEEYLRRRVDLTNLRMRVRIFRMAMGAAGEPLFERAFLEGGTLPFSFFTGEREDEASLSDALASTVYGDVFAPGMSMSALEKRCDNALIEYLRQVRYIPFGREVPFAFLMGAEGTAANLRMLFAGISAGQKSETIRERLRESYV